jgi:hypothetical protein
VHHSAGVRVAKKISGILQRPVLARRPVQMHDENPFESLVAQFAGEINEPTRRRVPVAAPPASSEARSEQFEHVASSRSPFDSMA